MCVCARACVRVRACALVRARACVHMCVRACMLVCVMPMCTITSITMAACRPFVKSITALLLHDVGMIS